MTLLSLIQAGRLNTIVNDMSSELGEEGLRTELFGLMGNHADYQETRR